MSAADRTASYKAASSYLAGGKTPAERAATYQKNNHLARSRKLSDARHSELKAAESRIHEFASSELGKTALKSEREYHGYAPDPDLQGPDAHKRAPVSMSKSSGGASMAKPEVKTIDPAKASADRREGRSRRDAAQKRTARANSKSRSVTGLSNTVAKATAKAQAKNSGSVASPAKPAVRIDTDTSRNGPKLSETRHLQPDQVGKHHAATSVSSAKKNASGNMDSPSSGRHSVDSPIYHALAKQTGTSVSEHKSFSSSPIYDQVASRMRLQGRSTPSGPSGGKHAGGYDQAHDKLVASLKGGSSTGKHAKRN